jgi:Concanavalin A-like lectin/glucanases superfamily
MGACQQLIASYTASGSSIPDITTGLVAYYPLNESNGNALDASGNSRTMTQSGTVGAGSGATANARGPYTTSDYFSRTDSALNLNNLGDWTICGWFYFASAPTFNQLVTQRQSSNTEWNFALQVYSGGSASGYYGSVYNTVGSAADVEAPGTLISSGAWHFVITKFTQATGLVEASIDAGSYASGLLGAPAQTTLIPTVIGKWEHNATSAGNAYLGKIRFYSGRLLDPAAINYLYNGGTFSTAP